METPYYIPTVKFLSSEADNIGRLINNVLYTGGLEFKEYHIPRTAEDKSGLIEALRMLNSTSVDTQSMYIVNIFFYYSYWNVFINLNCFYTLY